jgi:hypothetical protein
MPTMNRAQFLRSIAPSVPETVIIGNCGHTHDIQVVMGQKVPEDIGRLYHFVSKYSESSVSGALTRNSE